MHEESAYKEAFGPFTMVWGQVRRGYSVDAEGVLRLDDGGTVFQGNIDLRGTGVRSLGGLRVVQGRLSIQNEEHLTSLGELEEVTGDLVVYACKNLTSTGRLRRVGKGATFNTCKLRTCGDLLDVGESLHLISLPMTSLGKVTRVGGSLILQQMPKLKSLGELREIGGHLQLREFGCPQLKTLNLLRKVGGVLDAYEHPLASLGRLREAGTIRLMDCPNLRSLGWLERLGTSHHESAFIQVPLVSLGRLKEVKTSLVIMSCLDLESLGRFTELSSLKVWECPNLRDLGMLETLRSTLTIGNCGVTSLGMLRHVGGHLMLDMSVVNDLGALAYVGMDLVLPTTAGPEIMEGRTLVVKGAVQPPEGYRVTFRLTRIDDQPTT